MKYRYDTHVHTAPVSRCARATVKDTLDFYKEIGYDGIFVTNHFLDGNVNVDYNLPYKEKLDFYLSDYHAAKEYAAEIGFKVFFGVELSTLGVDFLVYGLPPEWYYEHPEIMDMRKKDELPYLREAGGLVIHAHPFRESAHIDHIQLYPRAVDGVEVLNSCRTEFENNMAEWYADKYGIPCRTAGSDNHIGRDHTFFTGMMSDTPLVDEADFVARVRAGSMELFSEEHKS